GSDARWPRCSRSRRGPEARLDRARFGRACVRSQGSRDGGVDVRRSRRISSGLLCGSSVLLRAQTVDDECGLVSVWVLQVSAVRGDDFLLECSDVDFAVGYGWRIEFGELAEAVIRVTGAFAVPELGLGNIGSVEGS